MPHPEGSGFIVGFFLSLWSRWSVAKTGSESRTQRGNSRWRSKAKQVVWNSQENTSARLALSVTELFLAQFWDVDTTPGVVTRKATNIFLPLVQDTMSTCISTA